MHLLTILAFAIVFLRAELGDDRALPDALSALPPALLVPAVPIAILIAACLLTRGAIRRLARHPSDLVAVQGRYHRLTDILHVASLLWFGAVVMFTPWPKWFQWAETHPVLQIGGDLIVLLPFFGLLVLLWIMAYPLEQALRRAAINPLRDGSEEHVSRYSLVFYLDHNLRHHVLVVAVPMALILFASDITRGYEEQLRGRFGVVWAADAVLAAAALVVFVAAPWLLKHIWRTKPLPDAPLRWRLEATCARIGLRIRDILVWPGDGTMVNAAVMGLFAPLRYVLLSDALLRAMSPEQIEAVFGHEAGHIRHRHIPCFLIFAFLGWLAAAGVLELSATLFPNGGEQGDARVWIVEGVGIAAVVALWGAGFGWLSRRFERQADLFGAFCATPDADQCRLPCSVHHGDANESAREGRVCATGARTFASALELVARLNGIAFEERSWRHATIGHRIRWLMRLAGDPAEARRFHRRLRAIKLALFVPATVGGIAAILYGLTVVPAK